MNYTSSCTALYNVGLNTYANLSTKIAKLKRLTLRECESPIPQSRNVEHLFEYKNTSLHVLISVVHLVADVDVSYLHSYDLLSSLLTRKALFSVRGHP